MPVAAAEHSSLIAPRSSASAADRGRLAEPTGPPDAADVAAVAETVGSVMRTLAKAKARMLADARHDVKQAASVLLRSLDLNGPLRIGALADSVQSDVSTVSRQVAALVSEGLLERRADQADGRACLLAPTEAGRAILAQHDQARLDYFADLLRDWSSEDVAQFAALLLRFSRATEQANAAWMSERTEDRLARTGGSTR
jgi:DNA-binding MarR family transcriptional regulator